MTILILYNGLNETNEVAFTGATTYRILDGSGIHSQIRNGFLVLNWASTPSQKVLIVGDGLTVYLLSKCFPEYISFDQIPQSHYSSMETANT